MPFLRPRIIGEERSSEACLETLTWMAFLDMQEMLKGLVAFFTSGAQKRVRLWL